MFTIWLIGNQTLGTVPQLLPGLIDAISGAVISSYKNLEAANRAGETSSPDAIVVFQHHPYEHPAREAERLLGFHPLAHVIVGLGPWCASAGRTHRIWPDAVTVPLNSISRTIQRLMGSDEARAMYPRTQCLDERVLNAQTIENVAASSRAVIVSQDLAVTRVLTDLIETWGGRVLPLSQIRQANIVFCDLDPIGPRSIRHFTAHDTCDADLPMIALTGETDADALPLLKRYGIDFVLAKPFDLVDLQSVFRFQTLCLSETTQRAA